jgi:hypothetical protein
LNVCNYRSDLLCPSHGGELAHAMAEQILEAAQAAVATRGVARIAISGGNTPKRTFELLAERASNSALSVGQARLFWVDERCVPPDDNDSNYRMTREALLDKVPLAADRVFRIEGELDPERLRALRIGDPEPLSTGGRGTADLRPGCPRHGPGRPHRVAFPAHRGDS